MSINIQGDQLLDSVHYVVRIGKENCNNMKVFSNLIICEPPRTRPEVAEKDYEGHNKIPVKVSVINTSSNIFLQNGYGLCKMCNIIVKLCYIDQTIPYTRLVLVKSLTFHQISGTV